MVAKRPHGAQLLPIFISLDLSQETETDERMLAVKAIHKLCSSHSKSELHDIEVESGLIITLCIQLNYFLNRNLDKLYSPLFHIFDALGHIYCCSEVARGESLQEFGENLLFLSAKALSVCRATIRKCNDEQIASKDHILLAVTGEVNFIHVQTIGACRNVIACILKLFRSLSRNQRTSLLMIKCDIAVLDVAHHITEHGNDEARVEAFALIKNLTFHAEEYRSRIMDQPCLLNALVQSCLDQLHSGPREDSSAIMRNLAMSTEAKLRMAEHNGLLYAMVQLSKDSNLKVRRNAISVIGSLAISEETRILIATCGEGMILDVLKRTILFDEDSISRRRAGRTFCCFGRSEVAELVANHSGVISSLCKVTRNDSNTETRLEAAEALAAFISQVPEPITCYEEIIASMVRMFSLSACTNMAAKILKGLAQYHSYRKSMAELPGVLKALGKALIRPTATAKEKECITGILFELSREEENKEKLTCTPVLAALTEISSNENYDCQVARILAIKCFVNIADQSKNRAALANFDGLLSSLVNFLGHSPDERTRIEVKQVLVSLVTKL